MTGIRPWFVDLVLAPLAEDDPFQPMAFKWAGDAASREDATALARADFRAAFRCALAALRADPADPPETAVSEANLYGRASGSRFLNWTLGAAADDLIRAAAPLPRRDGADVAATREVALCDPLMRARLTAGQNTFVTSTPRNAKGGWGAGCDTEYYSPDATGHGPHFAGASTDVMRAIACIGIARAQRGARRPVHAPVEPASATLRALVREGWPIPPEADAFLRGAGLGEIAEGLARCAAERVR